jgi:two-component system phosphate regulon sensor histidine kinase PhoR
MRCKQNVNEVLMGHLFEGREGNNSYFSTMKNRSIKRIAVLGAFVIIGIFIVQLYWLKKAFSIREKQFDQSVKIGLSRISQAVEGASSLENPFTKIEQHASNYYVLKLTGKVDTSLLRQAITNEFSAARMGTEAQYGLYDSSTKQLLYGEFLPAKKEGGNLPEEPSLPALHQGEYYLGLAFPSISYQLSGELPIWIFSTLLLLIFLLFYVYALVVLLKQKRGSEIQKDFVNNMTHEFKTPISTISLVAETLSSSSEVPASFSPFLEMVKQESAKLNAHVDKILLSNKSQSLALQKERLDVHALVVELGQQLVNSVKKGVDVHYELGAENAQIAADKAYVQCAIQNLLDNAVKYSKEEAKVSIKTTNQKGHLFLSISDNGMGIDRQYKNKIFDPFFRIPTGDEHSVKGFGIGLHFVKNIVKAHRWKVFYDSELQKGSCFTLQIPL